jgi:type IV secretory pathway VirB9-like protein
MRAARFVPLVFWLVTAATTVSAQPPVVGVAKDAPASFASRVVPYSTRDVVTLRAQVRFTTMVVLPAAEQILEVTCGDKELWLVNANQNFAYIKPAKPGSQTNLNLLTSSGSVYSFVLTEVSGLAGVHPDVKVYLEPAEEATERGGAHPPVFVSAQQVEEFRAQAEVARDEARHAREQALVSEESARRATADAAARLDRELSTYRAAYPTQLRFSYEVRTGRPPFFVTTIFHDGTRTYIQASATELPALYEFNDSGPNLVTFEYRNGTYVVPKVLDYGYLAIGKARLFFKRTR